MRICLLLVAVFCVFFREAIAQSTITVLTYNIHHGANEREQNTIVQIGRLIREYSPDLVALQEVDSTTTRSRRFDHLNQLSRLTSMYPLYGKTIDFQGGKYGIAILSKYPIIASQKAMLPNPDKTEPRALLCAYVELPNEKTIRFCNSQLDDKSPLNRDVQLAAVDKSLENSIQPVIWCGDFNTDPDDPEMEKLMDRWIDAGKDSQTPTLVGTGARIDYILSLKQSELQLIRYRVLNVPKYSDHLPVLATYRFRNPKK
ncbi:endonuclease/exonuclease/phosphatase family protein [Larkinella insperata]|uniref:Endonuclease/exonuclease/phosphatase family protein n=1 Tax=Larkinella insperata TaxID=332158 RepID=A0ABW3Q855_9BACT|nr:endonuclease/exonuclease/phosphatase family protein [Larkinella insperata]